MKQNNEKVKGETLGEWLGLDIDNWKAWKVALISIILGIFFFILLYFGGELHK